MDVMLIVDVVAVAAVVETIGMNSNVFKFHEELCDPMQFNRTLEALERYANTTGH